MKSRSLIAGLIAAAQLVCPWRKADLRADPPRRIDSAHGGQSLFPMPTLGGKQLWADELFFHQWRIQRHVGTNGCRLLDEKNLRHASGTFAQCRTKLEEIKRQRNLPPMQGRGVIVLHGLFRTRTSMGKLCKYLKKHGRHTVFNVGYPSTRCDVADHARSLARIIENLDGIDAIDFVAHSLGNVVIRRYLADQPDRRIKRFVMLAPPNHGSLAANALSKNALFTTLAGEPGRQLGRQWAELETRLVTPPCQFGIVAGGRGNGKGFNRLLPGDNDATITVATTRLAGASDFVVVPAMHSFIMNDARVMEYTLRFLENGYFVSPEKRQPVIAE